MIGEPEEVKMTNRQTVRNFIKGTVLADVSYFCQELRLELKSAHASITWNISLLEVNLALVMILMFKTNLKATLAPVTSWLIQINNRWVLQTLGLVQDYSTVHRSCIAVIVSPKNSRM